MGACDDASYLVVSEQKQLSRRAGRTGDERRELKKFNSAKITGTNF